MSFGRQYLDIASSIMLMDGQLPGYGQCCSLKNLRPENPDFTIRVVDDIVL
jgi:hypothetical protein